MFALFYTFFYINDVKKRIVLAKPQRLSLRIHLCASERSERAIFGVFNSFTVEKVSFLTINVKFKVILSSKSVGGGMFVQVIPPPRKVGDTSPTPPPPRDLRQWFSRTDMNSPVNLWQAHPLHKCIRGLLRVPISPNFLGKRGIFGRSLRSIVLVK